MNANFQPACDRMEWLDPFYKTVWKQAFNEAIPISGTFELTPRCNFNCKMCYVHLHEDQISQYGKELSAKEWIRIAKEAKEAGTTWLCITGGEPLMHPEFVDIWCSLSKMGFFLTLQTNASLITEKIQKLFENYPPRQVKITLYGTNDEVYEAVCGVKNGFSRVNDGIHTLMSLGIPVTLVSTIIKQNEENSKEMALYAYRHRLPWTITSTVRPSLRGADVDVAAVRLNEKVLMQTKLGIDHMIQGKITIDLKRKPCTYCRDYRIGYWIVWNGNMRFCSFLNQPNISLLDKAFMEAWNELLDYEESLDWPDSCKTCTAKTFCLQCVASLATESGEIGQVNEQQCELIKSYLKEKGEI